MVLINKAINEVTVKLVYYGPGLCGNESNLESLDNLKANLRLNRIDPGKIALVFQYNKRDLPNVDSVDDMNNYMHPNGVPVVEAAAINGTGVTATLRAAIGRILENL